MPRQQGPQIGHLRLLASAAGPFMRWKTDYLPTASCQLFIPPQGRSQRLPRVAREVGRTVHLHANGRLLVNAKAQSNVNGEQAPPYFHLRGMYHTKTGQDAQDIPVTRALDRLCLQLANVW
eukprot:scaffold646_cov367-Prasinococcus_capsulatus_cf.AAC.1